MSYIMVAITSIENNLHKINCPDSIFSIANNFVKSVGATLCRLSICRRSGRTLKRLCNKGMKRSVASFFLLNSNLIMIEFVQKLVTGAERFSLKRLERMRDFETALERKRKAVVAERRRLWRARSVGV